MLPPQSKPASYLIHNTTADHTSLPSTQKPAWSCSTQIRRFPHVAQWLLITNKIKVRFLVVAFEAGPHLVGAWFSCPVEISHTHTICSSSLFTKALTAPSAGSDLSPIVWANSAPKKPLCDLSIYRLLEEICHEKWAALQAFISSYVSPMYVSIHENCIYCMHRFMLWFPHKRLNSGSCVCFSIQGIFPSI